MLTIALTSIPPRFDSLRRVVEGLLAQTVPARVVVSLPFSYRRFPGRVNVPSLPPSVILHRVARDYGPATKLLGALSDADATDILYCDDDWSYAPTWAQTLLEARTTEEEAVAASSYPVSRLKHVAVPPYDRVAQGFAGVLVRKEMFDATVFDLPRSGYAVDDIWLSGFLAARDIPIRQAPKARALCAPINTNGPQLQTTWVDGLSRADANAMCAHAIFEKFGIWPSRTGHRED